MIGSTFIYETNVEKLKRLHDLDMLENFEVVYFDHMMLVDLAILIPKSGVHFFEKEPVVYCPDDGMVIAKVSLEGLKYIIEHINEFGTEFSSDLKKLTGFIKMHGYENIYELSTF